MRRFVFLTLVLLLVQPSVLHARTIGFAGVTLWFGKEPVFADVPVRVYTALINSAEGDLVGTVEFFDNKTSIGKVPVTVPSGGRIRDVWIDWTPSRGDHKVSARLIDAKLQGVGEEPSAVEPSFSEATIESRFIDADTDRDGVGDREDADDDGDGFTDEREMTAGTNPVNNSSFPSATASFGSIPASGSVSLEGDISSQISKVGEALKAKEPARVLEETKLAAQIADASVGSWRTASHAKAKEALNRAEARQADPVSKTPLGYFIVAGWWVLEKLLSKQVIFYGTIAIVLFCVVRFIRGRRNRLYY